MHARKALPEGPHHAAVNRVEPGDLGRDHADMKTQSAGGDGREAVFMERDGTKE